MPLTRLTRSVVHRLRLVMLVVTLLSLFSLDLARPAPGLAKEFDVIGTVDCGIPSGRRCDLDDTLVLLTDSVSGLNELVAIDISGIKRKLPALDQDDEITLCVESLPDGKLVATCVISAKRRDGTQNQGKSTGTVEVSESRRDRGLEQDKDQNPTRPIGGGVSGQVLNQVTGVPIPGATVRLNGVTLTTDANGRFSILVVLEPGVYQLVVTAPLFATATQQVVVESAGTTLVTIPLQPLPGVLTGIVRSLVTGAAIPGATVTLNGFSVVTDASGAFNIGGVPPGTYQAAASAPGFIPQTQTVAILATQATQANFALATAFPNLNFTLIWGASPPDLDAHLSGPGIAQPPRFHASFQNLNPETYVSHSGDDRDGFGPERITVSRNPATQQFVAGDYHFWVDNPEVAVGGPNYVGSQARVVVNQGAQLIGIFDVANATGDPNLPLWHVVNVQIDAAGNVVGVQPIQQFKPGDPVTILATPPGVKTPRR